MNKIPVLIKPGNVVLKPQALENAYIHRKYCNIFTKEERKELRSSLSDFYLVFNNGQLL